MFLCDLQQEGDSVVLELSGDLTVETVNDFVGAVLPVLESPLIEVRVAAIAGFDLCGLQSLYALAESRRRSNGALVFTGEEALRRFAAMARFAGLDELSAASTNG